MRLTRAFLDGMGESARVIHAIDADIKPCAGCFACWRATPGRCALNDGMKAVLDEIAAAELVIFSTPLYYFGMPAPLKAVVDRMLPLLTPAQAEDAHGGTYHPARGQRSARFMLISGCGFPNISRNYEGLLFQFAMSFGGEGFARILCAESPLLNVPEAAPVAEPYLALVREAGRAFAAEGAIPKSIQCSLDAPMMPPDEYRRMNSGA